MLGKYHSTESPFNPLLSLSVNTTCNNIPPITFNPLLSLRIVVGLQSSGFAISFNPLLSLSNLTEKLNDLGLYALSILF